MDPALMVVDVQQGFDDAGYWGPRNNPACEDNIAALIAHAGRSGWPLVYVRHDSDRGASPLRPDHPGNAFKEVVTGEPDVLVSKHTNSCFYGEPDLHGWLRERGIDAARALRDHDQPLLRDHRPHGRQPRLRRPLRPGRHAHLQPRRPHRGPARPRDRDNLHDEFATVVATADASSLDLRRLAYFVAVGAGSELHPRRGAGCTSRNPR